MQYVGILFFLFIGLSMAGWMFGPKVEQEKADLSIPAGAYIVLDWDRNGRYDFDVLPPADADRTPVYFDILASGRAYAVSWPAAGSEALLAVDRDGDGRISDGSELFGGMDIHDAITQLRRMDLNNDGVINSADSGTWAMLRVWVDKNGDGRSAPDELMTMDQAGISALFLPGQETDYAINGQAVVRQSGYALRDAKGRGVFGMIAVRPHYDPARHIIITDETRIAQIPSLPQVAALGAIADLHTVMRRDHDGAASTYTHVVRAAGLSAFEYFSPRYDLERAMAAIMYRMADVVYLTDRSQGPYLDMRKAGFNARVRGEEYQRGMRFSFAQAYAEERAFDDYRRWFMGQFLLQTAAREFLRGNDIGIDPQTGLLRGVAGTNPAAVENFARELTRRTAAIDERTRSWVRLLRFVDYAAGLGTLVPAELEFLDGLIRSSGIEGGIAALWPLAGPLHPRDVASSGGARRLYGANWTRIRELSSPFEDARKHWPRERELVLNDVADNLLRMCCETQLALLPPNLLRAGFTLENTPPPPRYVVPGNFDEILYATRKVADEDDTIDAIIIYIRGGKVDWAQGYVERRGRLPVE